MKNIQHTYTHTPQTHLPMLNCVWSGDTLQMFYCRPSKDITIHLCYVPGWNNAFLRFVVVGGSGCVVFTTGDVPGWSVSPILLQKHIIFPGSEQLQAHTHTHTHTHTHPPPHPPPPHTLKHTPTHTHTHPTYTPPPTHTNKQSNLFRIYQTHEKITAPYTTHLC